MGTYLLLLEYAVSAVLTEGQPPFCVRDRVWSVRAEVSLPGFFYDYLVDSNRRVAGVRYWLHESSNIQSLGLLEKFRTHPCAIFNAQEGYVDFLLNAPRNLASESADAVGVWVTQDFGGDVAIESGAMAGIGFELAAGLTQPMD